MLPLRLTLTTGFALIAFVSSAFAGPELPPAEWQTSVERIFGTRPTKDDVSERAGALPAKCLPLTQSDQICEWTLGRHEKGWRALARALDTQARVSVICRFSVDPTAELKTPCSARPMKSNRRMFSPSQFRRERERAQRPPRNAPAPRLRGLNADIRNILKPTALSWLNSARNLEELSRLLGALPNRCIENDTAQQICVWRTSATTYGHGTVAASIPVSGSKKVELTCTLPQDGGFRVSGDSCELKAES